MRGKRMRRVFVSYSSADEKLKRELDVHLAMLKRQGIIETWDFRRLTPGTEWDATIKRELDAADVILPLVSPDFLASGYCWDVEMMRALERHRRHECIVIPVIARDCEWQETPLGDIQALPAGARPIVTCRPHDRAWRDVAGAIRSALRENEHLGHKVMRESQTLGPQDAGLLEYHATYPKRAMTDHLAQARERICILQTWVSNWSAFWVAMHSALRIDAAGKVHSDVNIRVILIDPKSQFCALRGKHSGVSEQEAIDHTVLSVKRIREFKRRYNLADSQLEIRLSDELPTLAMFGTEQGVYFTPYLRKRITYESPCFVFAGSGGFADELQVHFNGLWEKLGRRKRLRRVA